MEPCKAEEFSEILDIARKQVKVLTTSFNNAITKIVSDFEDSLPFHITRKSTLNVSKGSVNSVVEINKLATSISSTARAYKTSFLNEEIDLKPYSKHLVASKKMSNEMAEIIGRLDSMKQATMRLSEHSRIQTKSSNDSESSVSSSSIPSSDSLISEFSLFDNSNTNVATSSPILDIEKDKKEQE